MVLSYYIVWDSINNPSVSWIFSTLQQMKLVISMWYPGMGKWIKLDNVCIEEISYLIPWFSLYDVRIVFVLFMVEGFSCVKTLRIVQGFSPRCTWSVELNMGLFFASLFSMPLSERGSSYVCVGFSLGTVGVGWMADYRRDGFNISIGSLEICTIWVLVGTLFLGFYKASGSH